MVLRGRNSRVLLKRLVFPKEDGMDMQKNCEKSAVGNVLRALTVSDGHAQALSVITALSPLAQPPHPPPYGSVPLSGNHCVCTISLSLLDRQRSLRFQSWVHKVLLFFYVRGKQNRTSYRPMSYSSISFYLKLPLP